MNIMHIFLRNLSIYSLRWEESNLPAGKVAKNSAHKASTDRDEKNIFATSMLHEKKMKFSKMKKKTRFFGYLFDRNFSIK